MSEKRGSAWRQQNQSAVNKRERDRRFRKSGQSVETICGTLDTSMFSYPCREMAPSDRALIEAFEAKRAAERVA